MSYRRAAFINIYLVLLGRKVQQKSTGNPRHDLFYNSRHKYRCNFVIADFVSATECVGLLLPVRLRNKKEVLTSNSFIRSLPSDRLVRGHVQEREGGGGRRQPRQPLPHDRKLSRRYA
jgi:hypothetical protein